MFDLNPLNLPGAYLQQWIMFIGAGVLGFIIGYIFQKNSINQIEASLATVEKDLDNCYRKTPVVDDTNDEEAIILNRIRARSSEINFGRIGMAAAINADDLKVINGIGPFLEKKLHAIGIYTFRQIANFSAEDIEQVNDIIEFFPGRIERDNWVGQASELAKNK